ncbi:hypothetical protein C8R46DRAFT_1361914 [Mycena filopes]|nr:hypothetical protein C8R46DRAFT_1361914 [Mycena filopes]
MHPALRDDAVNKLPIAMKRTARIASSPNSTGADVARMLQHLPGATEEQAILMLPVFYANLDPLRVPDEYHYDTEAPSAEAQNNIVRAFQSLGALYAIRFPSAIGVDLWPRAWPWARFLYLYREHLPRGLNPQSEAKFCLDFLMFAGTFADHPASFKLILDTPDLRVIVAKAWPHVLEVQEPQNREIVFTDLRSFLAHDSMKNPVNLAEIIDGAGSCEELARLVVAFIHNVVPADGGAMHFMDAYFLDGLLDFVNHVDPHLLRINVGNAMSRFAAALVSHNVVGAVTKSLHALLGVAGTSAANALRKSFLLIGVLFTAQPGNLQRIADAMDHGFLRALATGTRGTHAQALKNLNKVFLETLLPSFFLRFEVLDAMDTAIAEVGPIILADDFKASDVHELWHEFTQLVVKRLDLYDAYLAGEVPTMKACDNLKCNEIRPKDTFQRCGGCFTFHYCSSHCQRLDWRQGGHREDCKAYRTRYDRQWNSNDIDFTKRELSFLRQLLHRDFDTWKILVLAKQATFMSLNPGQSFVTLYNYSLGAVNIEVQATTAPDVRIYLGDGSYGTWDKTVSRAARSGGRLWPDVVAVHAGNAPGARYFVMPLRTKTSALYNGLKAIADGLPEDRSQLAQDDIMPLFEALADAEPDVLVIH